MVQLIVKVLIGVFVVLVLAAALLRVRKLRRDEIRELSHGVDRRLVLPPPSPYAPSRGFRVMDDQGATLERPTPSRPRLDPDQHYVFSDAAPLSVDAMTPTERRHDERWALERSDRHPHVPMRRGRLLLAIVIVVVLVLAAGFFLRGHRHPSTTTTTTTTTMTTSTSVTTTTLGLSSGLAPTYAGPLAGDHRA